MCSCLIYNKKFRNLYLCVHSHCQIEWYAVEILATDTGHVELTGTATVYLNLTDVNDTPPRFILDNNTAVVQVRKDPSDGRLTSRDAPL